MMRAPRATAQIARRFAPVVVLHPDDPWTPADPSRFIAESHLDWHAEPASTRIAESSRVDESLLGTGGGKDGYGSPAPTEPDGAVYVASELTRPFYGHGRAAGLGERAGFALVYTGPDVDRMTTLSQAPLFYQWTAPREIKYWWFFTDSGLPAHVIRAALDRVKAALHLLRATQSASGSLAAALEVARTTLPASSTASAPAPDALHELGLPGTLGELEGLVDFLSKLGPTELIHQGDWEGITVQFDDASAISQVFLHQHGRLERAKALTFEAERPVVLCALGSHSAVDAASAAAGETVASLADGKVWRPRRVVDAAQQPWFGFGGAWGRVRLGVPGASERARSAVEFLTGGDIDLFDESTGPLGLSSWKKS